MALVKKYNNNSQALCFLQTIYKKSKVPSPYAKLRRPICQIGLHPMVLENQIISIQNNLGLKQG
jgi:hypothetical protein